MFWGDKRYNSLIYYLKQTYGRKIYKLSLDGGMTCPNRDGTLDHRGCIFCSRGGSGDFAAPVCNSVTTQINNGIAALHRTKPGITGFIAYFQSYTNTYAPVEYLRKLFTEAIMHPDVVCLSIATRPDCLPDEVIQMLARLNNIKPVWVELGLQTIHEPTADYIRRGYPLPVYNEAVQKLSFYGIQIVTHVIIGLPGETVDDVLNTIRHVCLFPLNGIKLQLLHVLKYTDLADELGTFHILTFDEYTDTIVKCIEIIPQHIVIHRLTGDAPAKLLIEPGWSRSKIEVLNTINRKLREHDTWQGRCADNNIYY
mgnify:FL=1